MTGRGSSPDRRLTSFLRMIRGLLLRAPASGQHLPALEGIRGLAVVIVLLSHLSSAGVFVYPELSFRGAGVWAVYLFFVLSAFLLSWHSLGTPPRLSTSAYYWRDYAGRRIIRIYPVFILALLLTQVSPLASFALAGKMEPSVVRHLLLLDGYKIFWTIPVEFKFYGLLPFLLVGVRSATRDRAAWSVLLLVAILLGWSTAWPPDPNPARSLALSDFIAPFLFGTMAAIGWKASEQRTIPNSVRWGLDIFGVLTMVAILAPWMVGSPFAPTHRLAEAVLGSDASWYGAAWAIVIVTTLAGRGLLRRVFEFGPLRIVGVVSFSAYMWHMPILEYLRRTSLHGSPFAALLILAVIVAASILSYLLVERPAMEAFSNWSRRGRQRRLRSQPTSERLPAESGADSPLPAVPPR